MAVSSECRMRLFEFKDIAGGILADIPHTVRAMQPKLLQLHVVGMPADAKAFAEIDAANAIMGLTTAVVAEVVSSDNLDNGSAAGAVQSFTTIGIDGEDEIVARNEPMHATVGTAVRATTNLYKECFHIYANAHGTEDADATGNVDFRETDDTVICRIPATDNEGNGSGFKIPDNHVGMLYGGLLTRFSLAADEGVIIRIINVDAIDGAADMAAGDRAINWMDFSASGATQQQYVVPKGQMYQSGDILTFWHSSFVDAGENYDLLLNFLIWKK